jgi:hypothetical protein
VRDLAEDLLRVRALPRGREVGRPGSRREHRRPLLGVTSDRSELCGARFAEVARCAVVRVELRAVGAKQEQLEDVAVMHEDRERVAVRRARGEASERSEHALVLALGRLVVHRDPATGRRRDQDLAMAPVGVFALDQARFFGVPPQGARDRRQVVGADLHAREERAHGPIRNTWTVAGARLRMEHAMPPSTRPSAPPNSKRLLGRALRRRRGHAIDFWLATHSVATHREDPQRRTLAVCRTRAPEGAR